MQSEGETLDILLATHLPKSVVIKREAIAAATNVWTGGWLQGLLLTGEWYGRLTHWLHTKVQVWLRHSCLCCKRDGSPYPLSGQDFCGCLAIGYVPAIWGQVTTVFITKPSRNSYSEPRDFRPISLTSFLLKTMVRMMDRLLRDEIMALKPLHPNQHVCGNSPSSAWVEKAPDQP
jgi:hypothetical protein